MTRMQFIFRPTLVAVLGLATLAGCSSVSVPGAPDLLSPSSNEVDRLPTADRPQPDARGVITYPNYQVAVASAGDTVATIAGRLGLNAQQLADSNGLPVDATLRPGELVVLNSRVSATPTKSDGSVDVAALAGSALDRASGTGQTAAQTSSATGPEPTRHTVKRGESAYSVARLYDVSAKSLADWNGLDANLTVREGQVLLIPVAVAPAADSASLPGAGSPTPEPPSSTNPQPEKDLPSVAATAAATSTAANNVGNSSPAQTSASDTGRLMQPVSGRIVRGYTPGRNEGIDFNAQPGSPVRAAESGTVAAITRDVDQVPILVVRHSGNLLTVYANVDDIKVRKGSKVSRGQQIASVRNADPSVLHFEVRNGFESVDPVEYLAK